MHIVFAGGGTAGHINPAIAVAGYFKRIYPDCRISFIGTKKGLESRLVPNSGYDFYTIDVSGFQRSLSVKNIFKNISAVCKVFTSSISSRKLLKELAPDYVIGTGGYVCGPVLREAAKMGIKTAVHEANSFPGVTIKMLSSVVDRVMVVNEDAAERLSCKNPPVITGNPIRSALTSMTKTEARKKLGIPMTANVILSFGGSLGARALNEAMFQVIKWNMDNHKYYILHSTGKFGFEVFSKKLSECGYNSLDPKNRVFEYIDNMDVMLSAADIVIGRAGAMTINELQVCGKASILIPSPYVAENHQYYNALTLKNIGAADLIEEKDLSGEVLLELLSELFLDKKVIREMAKKAKESAVTDADRRIVECVLNI